MWNIPLKHSKQVFLMEKQEQQSKMTSGSHCGVIFAAQGISAISGDIFLLSQLVWEG